MRISDNDLVDSRITRSIIGGFYNAHNELGFGFLESVCVAALVEELIELGHFVEREVMLDVVYKGKTLVRQRIDLLVDKRIIVEVKAGERVGPSARLQLCNYLRATGLEVGLLLHFGPKARVTRVYMPTKQGLSARIGSSSA
jgi:GxxExxY protein